MSSPEQDWDEGGEGPADAICDEAVESAAAEHAARTLIAARDKGEPIPQEALQRLMAALAKIYAVRFQAGERTAPISDPRNMPATAVMITCASMLRALNIEVFELAIWQGFTSGISSKQE